MWRHKYELYEEAVQSPEADVAFIINEYKKIRKKAPHSLREDFCGTGALLSAWVAHSDAHSSVGIDLDPEPIRYGMKARDAELSPAQQSKLRFVQGNVLKATHHKADVICAFNYSYYIFKKRDVLLEYFRCVRRSLNKKGLFFLDAFGGTEAMAEFREHRSISGFTYYWHCESFNPLTHDCFYSIHFRRNKKGAPLHRRVFTYDWRFWTMPELKDLLIEAGFKRVRTYWEGDDKNGGGNGVFKDTEVAENCESWISYLVAEI